MTIGPVQLIAISFQNPDFRGKIMQELKALRENDTIRLLDLLFVAKDMGGQVKSMEMSDLSHEEALKLGAVVGALIGLGAGGREGAKKGAIIGALTVAENNYGLSPADVQAVMHEIPNGSAAAIILMEHQWAAKLKEMVVDAGGMMIAQGMVQPSALIMAGAELTEMSP